MLIVLPGAPRISEEAKHNEEQIDKAIESAVKGSFISSMIGGILVRGDWVGIKWLQIVVNGVAEGFVRGFGSVCY